VAYRQLNDKTIKDSYSLPRIDELLEGLAGNRYFTVLDLTSGYHQLEFEESHKVRTAFIALGFFEYKAFDELKVRLTTPPVLAYPDFSRHFIEHQNNEDMEIVIAYASCGFSRTERNYCANKFNFLFLKWCITQKCCDYLYGNQFIPTIIH